MVSAGFKVANVTAGLIPGRSRSARSMVCLSTLASLRAATCASRSSVSPNANRIEPSSCRQAKSKLRTSRLIRRAASMLGRRSSGSSKKKRANDDAPRPRHWQVAELRVLREKREEGVDRTGGEAIADDDAVDLAGLETAGALIDAERADHSHPFTNRDAQGRVVAAAANQQHGGVVE